MRQPLTVRLALLTAALLVILAGRAPAFGQPSPTPLPIVVSTLTPTPDRPEVAQYGLFETTLNVGDLAPGTLLSVQFVSPDGKGYDVPAFWIQPQQIVCSQDCAVELVRAEGDPEWRVRFSPPQPGEWVYTVRLTEGTAERIVGQGRLRVLPSSLPGIIGVGANGHYFRYANGAPYFPVGINLGWSWGGARNTQGYREWLQALAAAGGNYARLYVDVPWFIGLGWRKPADDPQGFQEDAWKLDAILQTAESLGIRLQLVLVWNQGWTTFNGLPVNVPAAPARPNTDADWFSNPHNIQLGGKYNTATAYFVSADGRADFKKRLRYLAARWGYSTSVFGWEIIDQLDRIAPTDPVVATDWLREMAAYLREVDAHDHPITAGLRDPANYDLLAPVVLDFSQVRYYHRRPLETSGDQVLGALNLLNRYLASADRPWLISEFSLNPWFEPTADDPTGVAVRATMWASVMGGAAGAASSWWWDTYLFPQNLLDILSPLADFTKGIPWDSADFEPVGVALMSENALNYEPVTIAGFNGTYGSTTPADAVFSVTADGVTPPVSAASSYLYGVLYGANLASPHTYIVTPPVDTRLTVRVARSSDRAVARLVVKVDGLPTAELVLSPNTLPTSLTVPLQAGEHRIVLENLGDDYLQLDSIIIEAYVSRLRSLGLADREKGIFLGLIQHRDYTWQQVAAGAAPEPISANALIAGMPAGTYQVSFWDPFTGDILGEEMVSVNGGQNGNAAIGPLHVRLLPTARMLAIRAIRLPAPGETTPPPVMPTTLPTVLPTETPTPGPSPTATPRVVGARVDGRG